MDPLGSPHPVLTNCFLVKRKVDNFPKSKFVLIATASYSTDPIVAPGSPLNDPAEISWNVEQVSRIFQVDWSGNAVVNSANQGFVPGVQDTDAYWVCTVKKNVTRVPTWLLGYRNSVNNAPFMVDGVQVQKRCGWMKGIGIGHVQYRTVGTAQVPYRALHFTIAIKSGQKITTNKVVALPGGGGPVGCVYDNWWKYELDQGNLIVNGGVQGNPNLPNYGQPLPATNADGTSSRTKLLLDGTGHKLTGGPLGNGTPQTAVYIGFMLKVEQNFNQLPLQ